MRTAAPETMNGPRRTPRDRLLSAGVLAVLTTAVLMLAAGIGGRPADAASGTTYSGGVNPTYTGSGTEPVTESACQQAPDGYGDCGFLTANGDGFTISLPSGFVAQYQGTAAGTVDNMAVVAAVVRALNPAKYAPADQSVVPSDLSVSPSYAAKLATVGVTPTEFLDWMFANVPAPYRALWVPGSALSAPPPATSSRAAGSTSPASASAAASASVTKAPGGTTTSASEARATKASSTVTAHPASVYPSSTAPLTAAQVLAAKASATASGTGGSSTAVPTSSTVNPGGVIANPTDCPAGESAAVEAQGGRCIPDAPLGVPVHPVPKPAPSLWTRLMRAVEAWFALLRPYWGAIAWGAAFVAVVVGGGMLIRKRSS